MKVTLKDIWSSQRSLSKLAKIQPLPIKTSYWVGVRTKKIMKEIEAIEEKRLELVKKYGESESGTTQVSVSQDNMEKFTGEFNDLLNTEIELDIQKFKVEEFIGNSSLAGEDMLVLYFLFEEPSIEHSVPQKVK